MAKIEFGSQPSSIRAEIAAINVVVLPDPAGPVTSSGELRWAITLC